MEENKLTPFEMSVCQEYFANGLNKTAAFRTCHRAAAGWQETTAWNRASEFFQKPHIVTYVNELHEQAKKVAADKFNITVSRVLQGFAAIAFFDIRKIFNDSGQLKHPANLDDATAAAISSIEVVTRTSGTGEDMEVEYIHKIKLHDKMRGLENLARYLHIYEMSGKEGEQDECRFKGAKIPDWMREMIPSAGEKHAVADGIQDHETNY